MSDYTDIPSNSLERSVKPGRPPAQVAFSQTEAQHIWNLMIAQKISEEDLLRRFCASDPARAEISIEHFHKLVKLSGERRPLVIGYRERFALAFRMPPRVFEEYLQTGDLGLAGETVETISESEKTDIWSEISAWPKGGASSLREAFRAPRSEDEFRRFLRDIMTTREIREVEMRWRIANLLNQGLTYAQIRERTGFQDIPIKKVDQWLRFGCGGYRLVMDRARAMDPREAVT